MRAGGQILTLLCASRTFLILRSLADGPKAQLALRRDTGSMAKSTLRGHLKELETAKAVAKRQGDSPSGRFEYELTRPGEELLEVAASLERWLADSPGGPLDLDSAPAKAAVKSLVDAWLAQMVAPLAERPLSLTELDKRLTTISYPMIERRLEAMRLTEQVDAGTRESAGTRYAVTDWVRRGLAPLTLGARWEQRNQPELADPVSREDIEEAVAIVSPLSRVPAELSGICQLAVRVGEDGDRRRFLGAIEAKDGAISFGAVYPQRRPDAWASATADTWFSTLVDADTAGLKLSGDRELARTVFDRLREALFGSEAEDRSEAVLNPPAHG